LSAVTRDGATCVLNVLAAAVVIAQSSRFMAAMEKSPT